MRFQLLRLFLCVSSLVSLAQDSSRPLPIEDILQLTTFAPRTPLALSPDAHFVAYGLTRPVRNNLVQEAYRFFTPSGASQESAGGDIWITNTKTGEAHNLTGGKASSWGPEWSPDGRFLAFYSDMSGSARLWIWNRTNGQMRQLSDVAVRPFFGFQTPRWSPDGRTILSRVLSENANVPELKAVEPRGATGDTPTVSVFTSPPPAADGAMQPTTFFDRADLALIDVGTGKVRRVARGARPSGYWFSPDGRFVAFTDLKGAEPNTQRAGFDLAVFPVDTGRTRVVARRIQQDYGLSVRWSPDGKNLAYLSNSNKSPSDCFVFSLQSGESRDITVSAHPPFDAHYGVPVWDNTSQNVFLTSWDYPSAGIRGSGTIWKASINGTLTELSRIAGRYVLGVIASKTVPGFLWAATRDDSTKQAGFWKVDLETGRPTLLYEGDTFFDGIHLSYVTAPGADGRTFILLKQDAQHPSDLWIADADFKGLRQLTDTNAKLRNFSAGASRLVEWRGAEGQLLRGALLLPSGYSEGRRYPLIVFVYGGGLESDAVNVFGAVGGVLNMQVLATRGYAVFLPDSPTRRGSPVKDIFDTVMPGVDKVIELGIGDPNRLGVMGQSYGGYSVLALVTQTTRFKAAVDCAGPSDLISYYGEMRPDGTAPYIGYTEAGQGGMEGPLWQYRDRYIQNSPVFFLDRIQTPLLIIHGEADTAVPHRQAEEVFVGLRRLGKEAVYAIYAGEDHGVGHQRLANGMDFWKRVIAWFDDHLKR